MGELRLRRELALHGRHHDVTALAVALLDGGNVLVEVEHVDELGDNELRLGGSLQRRGLREEVVLLEDLAVSADPAQTVAGRQDLGEGAQEDNEALGVHALERGQVLTFKAELAIGVILNDGDLVLIDDVHELLAALERPGAAGRVLEVGDDVDHLDVLGRGEHFLKLFHDHAVAVGGDGDKVRLAGLESVQGAEVGRALNDDDIALVAENTCRVIQTLLRARGHENVVRAGLDVELRFHAIGDLLTEVLKAVGAGVLECDSALLIEDGVGRGFDFVNGEELGRGHAAGKREHFRLVGQSEELADRGTLQLAHSAGKLYHF